MTTAPTPAMMMPISMGVFRPEFDEVFEEEFDEEKLEGWFGEIPTEDAVGVEVEKRLVLATKSMIGDICQSSTLLSRFIGGSSQANRAAMPRLRCFYSPFVLVDGAAAAAPPASVVVASASTVPPLAPQP